MLSNLKMPDTATCGAVTGPYTFYISASDPDANTSNELSKSIVVN